MPQAAIWGKATRPGLDRLLRWHFVNTTSSVRLVESKENSTWQPCVYDEIDSRNRDLPTTASGLEIGLVHAHVDQPNFALSRRGTANSTTDDSHREIIFPRNWISMNSHESASF